MLILEVLKVTKFNKSIISPDLFLLVSTASINFSACQLLYKTSIVIRKYIFTLLFLHIFWVVAVKRFFPLSLLNSILVFIQGNSSFSYGRTWQVQSQNLLFLVKNTLVLYFLINSVLKENKLLAERFIQQFCFHVLSYKSETNLLHFFEIHFTFCHTLSFPSFVHTLHTHRDICINY